MTINPAAILFIPLTMALGFFGYHTLVEHRNTVTFNFHADTKDGYAVGVKAEADASANSDRDFASDAEKVYARTVVEAELRSALRGVVLQDVANDACQFNNKDLAETFLQEVHGASFSHIANAGALRGITKISIPADEQVQLIARCAPVATPQS